MTTREETVRSRLDRSLRTFETVAGVSPAVGAVAAITLLSLALRFAGLGTRIAHFDEGRVAYWTLTYADSGSFSYRYIIHGPFVQHVNRVVFQLFGANDFTMRAVTALIGGLLPATVLLFRERLRPSETVLAAAFLAFNPILLYYSRFFRSTIVVAAFMFLALAALVRAYDRGSPLWLHGVALFTALGFAAKENAAVYILCYLGAGGLLLDFTLLSPAGYDRGSDLVRSRLGQIRATLTDAAGRRWVGYWTGHAVIAVGVFALTTLFFYAPRDPNGLGLWSSLASPSQFPALIDATVADIQRGMEYWFGQSSGEKCYKDNLIAGYRCFLEQLFAVLGDYAAPLCLFAVFGFLLERYATERPRPLVMLASYWGFVSVLGYPLGTDIFGAWIAVNALVPLAIPAAVGLAAVTRWGYQSLDERQSDALLAVLVLVVVGGQVAVAANTGVYAQPTDDSNNLVQYAQPADNFRPAVQTLREIAPANEGTDVLFYGKELVVEGEGGGLEPLCTVMVRTLPLHWYLQTTDAQADCAYDQQELSQKLGDDPPPVILVHADRRGEVERRIDGYDAETYQLRTLGRPVTFFVDRSAAANATSGS
jgi:uncharacterized protein (TIGR03663 family)